MERVYRHTPCFQATRQLFCKQRRGEFRFPVKCVRIINSFIAEIVECHLAGGFLCEVRIVACDYYPARARSDQLGEPIDERKLSDVIGERLQIDGIGDDGVVGTRQSYRLYRGIDGTRIEWIAAKRLQRAANRTARRLGVIERARKTDNAGTVGAESLHGLESDVGIAFGDDDSLMR